MHMVTGKVYKYGDNVDTDVIIPARYLNAPSPEELAKHCMEDIDPAFTAKVQPGDIIVGGANFGCGSFARIFYRNSINIGFPILECPEAAQAIQNGDEVSVDFATGVIRDDTTGQTFQAAAFPPFIQRIIEHNGLLPYLKARMDAGEVE